MLTLDKLAPLISIKSGHLTKAGHVRKTDSRILKTLVIVSTDMLTQDGNIDFRVKSGLNVQKRD